MEFLTQAAAVPASSKEARLACLLVQVPAVSQLILSSENQYQQSLEASAASGKSCVGSAEDDPPAIAVATDYPRRRTTPLSELRTS
ncbi:hypothetical protein PsYK624_000590 [Phanerochaete sordida]|uniref:Uncharacterized protein n=1 Tax=Phanerochaete sordida TaxID=48140 RepID=A0A9P3FXC6_9APHY|nr:hypothetical protein PsYK624_000590 [Phanerochaete sordida]